MKGPVKRMSAAESVAATTLLRDYRTKADISLKRSAYLTGMSWQLVSCYERGERRISLDALLCLLSAYSVPLQQFAADFGERITECTEDRA